MDAPTIKIGHVEATLARVGISTTLALHIDSDDPRAADVGVRMALGAAALRMCWPEDVAWPARRRPRPLDPGGAVIAYGQKVLDDLYPASGMKLGDLAGELQKAREWVQTAGLSEADVQAARDFSEAPEPAGA